MKVLHVSEMPEGFDWNGALDRHDLSNIYASKAWGEYKGRLGWTVKRIAIRDAAGDDLGLVQYQRKTRGPLSLVFAQGCPILTDKGALHAREVFDAFLEHLALGPLDLLAIKYLQFETTEATLALLAHRFRPVVTARDHTLEVDLTRSPEEIRANLDCKWRKTLSKLGRGHGLDVAFLVDPADRLRAFDAFSGMYTELQDRKGFRSTMKPGAYRDLAANDPGLEFQVVRENGEPILVRIVHKARQRWTDFFVASNERARATEAPRLALWLSLERARQAGATLYDLGGIDPAGNRGVYVFKLGLTRHIVQSTPLWLYSRSTVVRDGAALFFGR